MMKLTIKTTIKINVPNGTKVIRNDEWLTLARKNNGAYHLLTCLIEDVGGIDFTDETKWEMFTRKELTDVISKLK